MSGIILHNNLQKISFIVLYHSKNKISIKKSVIFLNKNHLFKLVLDLSLKM